MSIQWWYWIILGCVLCITELALPALILVWLGIAAILTGLLLRFIPLSLTAQLAFWGLLSIVMTMVFLRYFKPRTTDVSNELSDQAINEVGLMARRVEPWSRGEILFQKPILGTDRWACVSEQTIDTGARARVVGKEGSVLHVVRA